MKKRLKIAEQILIVLSLALILPLVIAGAIIINTNQIAVRKELVSSATIIANSFVSELMSLHNFERSNLYNAYVALKTMPNNAARAEFKTAIMQKDKNILDFSTNKIPADMDIKNKFYIIYESANKKIMFSSLEAGNVLITKTVSINYINDRIFQNFDPEKRQIYILDANKMLLMSKNFEEERFKNILEDFPDFNELKPVTVFGRYKNQPNVMIFIPEYNWYVIVSSPKSLTYYGIIDAKRKMISAICVAAVFVFVLFGIYTFSLYTNIRQFFKAIRSIADGNYARKLRVVVHPFTSQEVIFISDEFNKMLEKIDKSYSELNETNIKLKKMDEYKSNLIDTVSHEFRTPLTSIKGYASSLLRHDVQLDADARKKSLKIIKNQAERLSRMVEDLLVIPDIESSTIRMNYKEVNLKNVIETSILSTSKVDTSIFETDIQENLKTLYADEDRLIQILINLLENAVKYSKEDTSIQVFAETNEDYAVIKIKNEVEYIDKDNLNDLFHKFTRADDNLTRTTRGTGLGLFIVKGLVETMGGSITLDAEDGFEVAFTIPVYKGQDVDA